MKNVVEPDKPHPIITNQKSVEGYFDRYIKKCVDVADYFGLKPKGSQPGKLYGMAKVHKDGCPLRPVVSMINTPEYNLAKWLDGFIKRFIPSQHTVSSTKEFIGRIKSYSFSGTELLCSFDVTSLFTNVPLKETIDIIANYVYSDDNNCKPSFSKQVFTNMLEKATSGMFLYKDKLYRQIDGVAMGSPLGPTFDVSELLGKRLVQCHTYM